MLRASAILAVVAGLAMAGVKFALAEALWWPFAIIEYVAATLLVGGAALAMSRRHAALLAAGWGLTAGVTWSTLFHHLQANAAAGALELGLGALLGAAVVGLALAVLSQGGAPAGPLSRAGGA